MIKEVFFLGATAARYIENTPNRRFISIHAPDELPARPVPPDRNTFIACFHDVSEREAQLSLPGRYQLFSEADACRMAETILRWNKEGDNLSIYVNCAAGYSRSPAIAQAICDHFRLSWDDCKIHCHPGCQPNIDVRLRVARALRQLDN